MSEPFLGEIKMIAFDFAPKGFAFCYGQVLSISQNQSLFNLIGDTYGGNGTSTFALPDLRGRVPINAGQGPGLSNRTLGQSGGSETVTLTESQLPAHNHDLNADLNATSSNANTCDPAGKLLAKSNRPTYLSGTANIKLDSDSISGSTSSVGGGQTHNNVQPFLSINFVIALTGIFPSEN
ncbi:MAG: tail fiber protein [Spirulinaceae cyanobacterium]